MNHSNFDQSERSTRTHVVVACHAWYGDVVGGSFRLASELAEHLASRGHLVSYVCCSANSSSDVASLKSINGVQVHRYRPSSKRLTGIGRLKFHITATRKAVQEIHTRNRVNVISGHSPLQALGAFQAIDCDSRNYTVHSPFDDELLSNSPTGRPRLMTRFASYAARWVDRRNVQMADCVQTVSQYTQDIFLRRHANAMRNKGVVAPGWVNGDSFKPAKDRLSLRQSLGTEWQTDQPLLFTLRRLESRMGLDTLVAACHQLAQEGLSFRMLIGGDGSLKQQLQEMIIARSLQDRVILLGRLPENQLAATYASADCFVLPTKALECFGLIVLEAFACQTPVIASATAAIPELAAQQGSDWMFEPGNVEQLTCCLRKFITNQLKPTVQLREIALKYDKPKVLANWEELLKL